MESDEQIDVVSLAPGVTYVSTVRDGKLVDVPLDEATEEEKADPENRFGVW